MSIVKTVEKFINVIGSPLEIINDWAHEPLKRWENKREQQNEDANVKRKIQSQTGVKIEESRLRREESEHESKLHLEEIKQEADIKIKMATEIKRIDAETEEWKKDKEFQRWKDAVEAVAKYKEQLTNLQIQMVRELGSLTDELWEKTHALAIKNIAEYKKIQGDSLAKILEYSKKVEESFPSQGPIYDGYVASISIALSKSIDETSKFISNLNEEEKQIVSNINEINKKGQIIIEETLGLPPSQNGQNPTLLNYHEVKGLESHE